MEQTRKNTKQEITAIANAMQTAGATPGIIRHWLFEALNTELEAFMEQLPEAAATLKEQAVASNEPNRWDDFIADLGNIAKISYLMEKNRKAFEAMNELAAEAETEVLQQMVNQQQEGQSK